MAFGIGLIGAGGNQKLRHIPGFRAINDIEIVNVVNRSRESGERVAAEYRHSQGVGISGGTAVRPRR